MNWPSQYDLENFVRDQVTCAIYSLGIDTEWIGDPSTSQFGIRINLTYNGYPIGESTIVDFIGKTD